MKKIKNKNKLSRFFRFIYLKLFRINDSPHKIAFGLGLGVFTGIFPGTGPLAALFLAFIFRVNRAASLLGSILTNTWLSIVIFFLSIKVGSVIMGLDWQVVRDRWLLFLKEFHWQELLKLSALKIIAPVLVGYLIQAVVLGVITYALTLALLNRRKKNEDKNRVDIPG